MCLANGSNPGVDQDDVRFRILHCGAIFIGQGSELCSVSTHWHPESASKYIVMVKPSWANSRTSNMSGVCTPFANRVGEWQSNDTLTLRNKSAPAANGL